MDDVPHGFGQYVLYDGATYIGDQFNGLRHGQGCFTDENGRTVQGKWEDNYCVE